MPITKIDKLNIKFCVISRSLPPSSTGQAIILFRILSGIDPKRYILVSQDDYSSMGLGNNLNMRLESRYYRYYKELFVGNFSELGLIYIAFQKIFNIFYRFFFLLNLVEKEELQLIIACTGGSMDILIGYLVSNIARIRFIPYIFDDYNYDRVLLPLRFLLRIGTRFIFNNSEKLILTNEYLLNQYKTEYHVDSIVIHNPYNQNCCISKVPWPLTFPKIRIVYTGSIYDAHYSAVKNLLYALDTLNNPNIIFEIYTPQTRTLLEQHDIIGDYRIYPVVNTTEINKIQQLADILFLPLSFTFSIHRIIRTSSPGKMAEYLASNRPILVHSPKDLYISWYFKNYGAGWVVDKPDPILLCTTIEQIINDPILRKIRCLNALDCVKRDFSLETSRKKFIQVVDGIQ